MSTIFNQVAVNYDTFRPSYPAELFDAIERYAGPLAGRRVLDMAAGTGIGSRGLIARGPSVTAIDLGMDMLRLLRNRSPDIAVLVARGERLPFAAASYDVICCACGWHWLDAEQRSPEVQRVLRPGGTLALWWAFGGVAEDEVATQREREVYEKWRVGQRELITPEPDATYPMEDLPTRGFVDVEEHSVTTTREVTVAEHIGHLSTHSPVLALRDDLPGFQADLFDVYAGRDSLVENVSCRLFLARSP